MVDTMKDDRAIELYADFRNELSRLPHCESAPYPKIFEGGRYHILAMPFHTVARDALREIANSVNDFGSYIRVLRAWQVIFERVSEDEGYNLLLEHVRPYTVLCLGAPQALRGRLIYAATATSLHANRFLTWFDEMPRWNGEHTSMKTAKAMSDIWKAWPALAAELNVLGRDQLSMATDDFRNKHEHGHPRGIGMGHISVVQRVQKPDQLADIDSKMSGGTTEEYWSFGEQPPIQLAELLPLFEEEHSRALKAFKAYIAMVEEQNTAAPPPA